ncbi:MAG: hypothetical protein KDB79_09225, partial [Acidobacteria bacterium]|nr:hypothetical protein [Acidobacteriota bacterium]
GNVLTQTISTPAGGGSGAFTAIQTYNYDPLNRIQDATETIGGSQTGKQNFSYDRGGQVVAETFLSLDRILLL